MIILLFKGIYYFNFDTGESSWEHPCDVFYERMFAEFLLFQNIPLKPISNEINKPSSDQKKDLNPSVLIEDKKSSQLDRRSSSSRNTGNDSGKKNKKTIRKKKGKKKIKASN